MKFTRVAACTAVLALAGGALAACGGAAADDTVRVAIGYQSKTINTVTAGTLMRELDLLEKYLDEASQKTGKTYEISWHDFASGPPLTAEMIAEKVDIGSMGDYPLSVNGAMSAALGAAETRWVSVTGYNLGGALNQIVVPTDSKATRLNDLDGQVVSTSLGSTAHGNLVRALDGAGMSPEEIEILGQDPPVGMTSLESKQVAALAQFVPFPQKAVFEGTGRLLHNGKTGTPTFHGVVANEKYIEENPEVMTAFLAAQKEATEYLQANPLEAAEKVAAATGLPPELVYLYNGPNGAVTFDLTIKPQLVDAVKQGLPFLKDLGSLEELDVDAFVDDGPLKEIYGADYAKAQATTVNASAITGHDEVCDREVEDAATASEAWPAGSDTTKVAATPTCLLMLVAEGGEYRSLYVPDTASGTRIFGQFATWVMNPALGKAEKLLPFATVGDAEAYAAEHTGATVLGYDEALEGV